MIDYVFPDYLLGMMFIAGYANYPIYMLILRSKLKESGWHAVFCQESEVDIWKVSHYQQKPESAPTMFAIVLRCCYSSMFVC